MIWVVMHSKKESKDAKQTIFSALRGGLHCNAGESEKPKNWTQ
jgi:hypothetical protein